MQILSRPTLKYLCCCRPLSVSENEQSSTDFIGQGTESFATLWPPCVVEAESSFRNFTFSPTAKQLVKRWRFWSNLWLRLYISRLPTTSSHHLFTPSSYHHLPTLPFYHHISAYFNKMAVFNFICQHLMILFSNIFSDLCSYITFYFVTETSDSISLVFTPPVYIHFFRVLVNDANT